MKTRKKNKPYTILFICSGNSCRSPMAEGLLRKKFYAKYGDQVRIHSAGILGIDGNPATLPAIDAAKEKGVDISNHKSKGIKKADVAEADIIFALADNHKEYLDQHFSRYKENVFLLKTFATDSDKPKKTSIDDPIGQGLKVYRRTINEIDKELNRILPQLEKLINFKLTA